MRVFTQREKLFISFACGLLFIIPVYFIQAHAAEVDVRVESFRQILNALKYSYDLDEAEVGEMYQCLMQNGFRNPKRDTCAPHDIHARYEPSSEVAYKKRQLETPQITSYVAGNGIGYLKLKSFWKENLAEDVESVLREFRHLGVRKLLLDLRDNLGGISTPSINIVNFFAPKEGLMLIEARNKQNKILFSHKTDRAGPYNFFKMVILVNQKTASASEIAVGILQIWGHTIIGAHTFGKGSMQAPIPLKDGGVFYVTIGNFYFSNGSTPEGKGIVPDVVLEANPEDQLSFAMEYLRKM